MHTPAAPPTTFAGRLRWLREDVADLSARELDRRAGKAPGHANRIETSPDMPVQTDTIEAYARVFGVDPGWLGFGTGEQPIPEAVLHAIESGSIPANTDSAA